MAELPASSVGFLRAFVRALGDRKTYDVRTNAGLWLGFVLALPIPAMAALLDAPPHLFVASLVAPPAWAVIVGASRRVGIIGEEIIQRMRLQALAEYVVRSETLESMNRQVMDEREERRHLQQILRVVDAELNLAEIVQRSLVPSEIHEPGLVVAIRQIPCAHVGGDYVRASRPRPDLLYLCMADVAGHGVSAALVVSRIHGHVQLLIHEEARLSTMLASLDRSLRDLLEHAPLYMTLAVLRIDLSARTIEYATAGHPPQFLRRSDGRVEDLFTHNRPLGLELGDLPSEYVVGNTTWEPGDTLLLFTDGLYEVMDTGSAQEAPGAAVLRSIFLKLAGEDPDVLADRMLDEVSGSRAVHPGADDMSLLVARLGA